ncbi:MAG: DUF1284 domain-containing protein [Nitrospiraceae bacterium]|nr:MAG: DUF1284 domain-containing protein [Nitrospiraceae bacterium]
MPSLRGHHLICLQFFHGEGYDDSFIHNLKKIIDSAGKEIVTISSGADDVCNKCINLKKGRCVSSDDADKFIKKMDIKALALLGLTDGKTVNWADVRDDVNRIFPEWYFQYCTECEWKKVCAKDDYFKELLHHLL